ncbi:sperm equatorial segment protein 1 [Macrotis lagotis]|uniref:sperm equatorial segment protein 1 n=1 Tax=Macrotis lagotis TaxID=92651 RepID=UPI003D68816A
MNGLGPIPVLHNLIHMEGASKGRGRLLISHLQRVQAQLTKCWGDVKSSATPAQWGLQRGRGAGLHVGFGGCWDPVCPARPPWPSGAGARTGLPMGLPSARRCARRAMPPTPAGLVVAALLLWPLPALAHPHTKKSYIEREPSASTVMSVLGPNLEAVKLVLGPVTRLEIKSLKPEATTILISPMQHLVSPWKSIGLLPIKQLKPDKKQTVKPSQSKKMKLSVMITKNSSVEPTGLLILKPTIEPAVESTSMKKSQKLNVHTSQYLPLDKVQKGKIVVDIANSVPQLEKVLREQLKIIDTLTKYNSKSQSNSLTRKYKILKDQLVNEYMLEDKILQNILETNKMINHDLMKAKQMNEFKGNIDSSKNHLTPNHFLAAKGSFKKVNKSQKGKERSDDKKLIVLINFFYDYRSELTLYLNINNIPSDIREKAATLFNILKDILCENKQRNTIKRLLEDNLTILNMLGTLLH